MRILIAAVGRARPGPERDLFEHYKARLRWPLTLREVEEKRPLETAARRSREAELLLGTVPSGAVLVALDQGGTALSSEAFARKLRGWEDSGVMHQAFLIGGADGHGEAVIQGVDFVLSFGRMTWPHLLVRGMLAEQLYRAQQILAGHPYHRA